MEGKIYVYIIYFQIFIHLSVNFIFKSRYILIVKYISFETKAEFTFIILKIEKFY